MCMTAWNSPITPVKGQTLRGEACVEEVYSCYDCFVGGGGGFLQSVLAVGLRMRKCVSVVCVSISVGSSLFLDPPIS